MGHVAQGRWEAAGTQGNEDCGTQVAAIIKEAEGKLSAALALMRETEKGGWGRGGRGGR